MPDHPTGNPDLIHQHKAIQRQGDRELKGGEPKGKDTPSPDENGLPEQRTAGVVKSDNAAPPQLPMMKGATDDEVDGEASGEASTGAGANPGP
jgi:hypothetical protein